MGIVIQLRAHQPLALPRKRWHEVWIRVTDRVFLEETRWAAQWPIQNAAGFTALKGFTDRNARLGKWHRFYVSGRMISRFCRQIEWLENQSIIEMEIDGQSMKARKRKLSR